MAKGIKKKRSEAHSPRPIVTGGQPMREKTEVGAGGRHGDAEGSKKRAHRPEKRSLTRNKKAVRWSLLRTRWEGANVSGHKGKNFDRGH